MSIDKRNRASAFRTIQGEFNRVLLEGKQRPVIIVDEAQHLRNEVLEDLRFSPTMRWILKIAYAYCLSV